MPARRNPPLTEEEVLAAATSLMRRAGLDVLSMRAVAAELGVTPMALYHHVGDKDRLLAIVADAVVAGVALPPGSAPWDSWLRTVHDGLRAALADAPGVATYLLAHPSTPAGAALRAATVQVLEAAGADRRAALLAASTFHTHLLGRLAVEAHAVDDEEAAPEPNWRAEGLAAEDYVAFGLDVVIDGIRAELRLSSADGIS